MYSIQEKIIIPFILLLILASPILVNWVTQMTPLFECSISQNDTWIQFFANWISVLCSLLVSLYILRKTIQNNKEIHEKLRNDNLKTIQYDRKHREYDDFKQKFIDLRTCVDGISLNDIEDINRTRISFQQDKLKLFVVWFRNSYDLANNSKAKGMLESIGQLIMEITTIQRNHITYNTLLNASHGGDSTFLKNAYAVLDVENKTPELTKLIENNSSESIGSDFFKWVDNKKKADEVCLLNIGLKVGELTEQELSKRREELDNFLADSAD